MKSFKLVILAAFICIHGLGFAQEEDEEEDDSGPPPAIQKPVFKPALVQQPAKRKCRVRGQNYDLDDAYLPYCALTPAQQKAAAIAARNKALASQKPKVPVFTERRPASAPKAVDVPISQGTSVTFESYIQENSHHPALTPKINNRQTAFVEVSKPASIGINIKEDEALPPAPTVLGTPVPSMEKQNDSSSGSGNSAPTYPAGG